MTGQTGLDCNAWKKYELNMWKREWDALSIRIAGIVEAATFLYRTGQVGQNDEAYSTNILIENCEQTAEAVLSLLRYKSTLPPKAVDALTRFEKWWRDTNVDKWVSAGGYPVVQAFVVLLASIRSELDHLFADHDEIIRSHVTRAFMHLERSLVVDDGLRARWLAAFEAGETECERLGGVHLLLHGIWAFKANASGERTDLVLGTHLVVDQDVLASTHGLVVTEWKLVRKGDSPEGKKQEALHQARRYSGGSLGGFVLNSERYLVLVAIEEFAVPKDEIEGDVRYKVVPLFLTRKSPSISARDQN
jgi:hypothetical protein